ncbi:MAG TPA: hypothetical protein VGR89_04950, partial [Puia sp.]|nr:hypothetical protein [Puia sp.]
MEVPPWTVANPGGGQFYFCHNGTNSFTYDLSATLVPKTTVDCQGRGPYFATGPVMNDPWRRNYAGIYSAQAIQHPEQGLIDLAFCHNENKNICGGPENSIDPAVPADCANPYQGYFAFVSAVWTASGREQEGFQHTLGPILWPGSAYVAPDGVTPATQGLLQPSSIVDSGYVYVFIWDKGPTPGGPQGNPGISRGIKLVRAPLAGSLDPSQYEVYYKDPSGNVQWMPSLPAGFSYQNIMDFVKVQGPLSTDILPDELVSNTECFRFTAARVNGTNYFVGLEEYVDHQDMNTEASNRPKPRHHVALRLSYDLINWSPRVAVIETSPNWDASGFNYPIFLSADGSTNTAVDLNRFYVVGTHSQPPFVGALPMMTITCSATTSPNADSMFFANGASVFAGSGMTANVFPNPTRGSAKLSYTLSSSSQVRVLMMNALGQRVRPLTDEWRAAGSYT